MIAGGELRTANTAVRATLKSREQSENVYENKEQVQKVAESYSARPNVGRTSSGRGDSTSLEKPSWDHTLGAWRVQHPPESAKQPYESVHSARTSRIESRGANRVSDRAVPRGAEKVAILSTRTIVIRGTPSKALRYSRIDRRSPGDLRIIGYAPLTAKDCLNGLPGCAGKTP